MNKELLNRIALAALGAGVIATIAIPGVMPWAGYIIPAGVGIAMSGLPSDKLGGPIVDLVKTVISAIPQRAVDGTGPEKKD